MLSGARMNARARLPPSGENQPEIRRRICRDAAWLGLELDDAANATHGPRISAMGSRVSAWVVPTDEETMIARHVDRLLE